MDKTPCKQWDERPHPIAVWMCHSESFPHYASNRSLHMEIKTISIDLAKNVFQVHAVPATFIGRPCSGQETVPLLVSLI